MKRRGIYLIFFLSFPFFIANDVEDEHFLSESGVSYANHQVTYDFMTFCDDKARIKVQYDLPAVGSQYAIYDTNITTCSQVEPPEDYDVGVIISIINLSNGVIENLAVYSQLDIFNGSNVSIHLPFNIFSDYQLMNQAVAFHVVPMYTRLWDSVQNASRDLGPRDSKSLPILLGSRELIRSPFGVGHHRCLDPQSSASGDHFHKTGNFTIWNNSIVPIAFGYSRSECAPLIVDNLSWIDGHWIRDGMMFVNRTDNHSIGYRLLSSLTDFDPVYEIEELNITYTNSNPLIDQNISFFDQYGPSYKFQLGLYGRWFELESFSRFQFNVNSSTNQIQSITSVDRRLVLVDNNFSDYDKDGNAPLNRQSYSGLLYLLTQQGNNPSSIEFEVGNPNWLPIIHNRYLIALNQPSALRSFVELNSIPTLSSFYSPANRIHNSIIADYHGNQPTCDNSSFSPHLKYIIWVNYTVSHDFPSGNYSKNYSQTIEGTDSDIGTVIDLEFILDSGPYFSDRPIQIRVLSASLDGRAVCLSNANFSPNWQTVTQTGNAYYQNPGNFSMIIH